MKKIILLLLAAALVCAGCSLRIPGDHEWGYWSYTLTPETPSLALRAEQGTFPVDGVTLELAIGLFDKDYDPDNWLGHYSRPGLEQLAQAPCIFALYVCDKAHQLDIYNDLEVADYKAIADWIFLEELTEDAAKAGSYGYTMSHFGFRYDHIQALTIPAEAFSQEQGSLSVVLASYLDPQQAGAAYYCTGTAGVTLDYRLDADGNVILE